MSKSRDQGTTAGSGTPITPNPLDHANATSLDPGRHPSGGSLPTGHAQPDALGKRWTPSGGVGEGSFASAGRDSPVENLPKEITAAQVAKNVDRYGENSSKFWGKKE